MVSERERERKTEKKVRENRKQKSRFIVNNWLI